MQMIGFSRKDCRITIRKKHKNNFLSYLIDLEKTLKQSCITTKQQLKYLYHLTI